MRCFSSPRLTSALLAALLVLASTASAQIGRRFPSEKKIVPDPYTGVPLVFLTSTPAGDSKIYPTHRQWTADGQWLIFRSNRVRGQAMAVHESTGDIVQVTEGGYTGMLCAGYTSMRLFLMRPAERVEEPKPPADGAPPPARRPAGPMQIVAVDLATLFADSAAGTLKPAAVYERVLGTVPAEMGAGGDMAVDATENEIYFRVGRDAAAKLLPADTKIEANFGPRNMGAGPTGIAAMDVRTGAIRMVVAVPFQGGHLQTNPWVPGELVFSWETGGKSPQRTWTVRADGTGLRPVYEEADYDWVTHEAIITKDEVVMALMGHRAPGTTDGWGPSGSRAHATGLGVMNLRTKEFLIIGQTPAGSGLWHVHGSSDGRWAVGDDFARHLYLIDRHTREMMLISTGHKVTAADHPHPTFSPDGTKFQIQSAMLSEDDRSMNLCVIHVPEAWLKRTPPPPPPPGPARP